MTWTYTPDFTQPRDQIRRLIGDVDSANPLLSDEEIAFYSTLEPNIFRAAASACEGLAAAGSGEADFAIGGKISQRASQSPTMYAQRAKELRRRANRTGAVPYAGGISLVDKHLREDDDDRVAPAFTVRPMTEPRTENQSDSEEGAYPVVNPW